ANELAIDPRVTLTGTANTSVPNWSVCFSSRGLSSVYDGSSKITNANLALNLTDPKTNNVSRVTIYPGGATDTQYIASSSGTSSPTPTNTATPTATPNIE
ncbi:MAG: hypothetical protein ACKO5Q_04385, partial [Microcystaceae cyanobacterium]